MRSSWRAGFHSVILNFKARVLLFQPDRASCRRGDSVWLPIISVNGVILARSCYQAYIKVHIIAFAVFLAFLIFAGVVGALSAALTAAAASLNLAIGSPLLRHHFGDLDPSRWLALLSMSASALLLAPFALVGLHNFLHRLYADKLGSILLLILLLAVWPILVIAWAYRTRDPSTEQVARLLVNVAYAGVALLFATIHLVCAILTRFNRAFSLSTRAAQINLSAIRSRYRIHLATILTSAPIIFSCIKALATRGIVIAALSAVIYIIITEYRDDLRDYLSEPALDLGPSLLLATLAIAQTVLRLVTTKLDRLMNSAVLFFLADTTVKLLVQYQLLKLVSSTLAIISTMILLRTWFFAPLRKAISDIGHIAVRTATEASKISVKQPLLLLRSFDDDQMSVSRSYRAFSFMFGGRASPALIEEVAAETLFGRGPVIAMADPRSRALAPLGAVRDLILTESWKDHVIECILKSQAIVCILGRSPSFQWEIQQIVSLGALQRVILILGPDYPDGRSISSFSPLIASQLGLDSLQPEQLCGRGVRAISFDAVRSVWCAVASRSPTERGYIECIRIASEIQRGGANFALESSTN